MQNETHNDLDHPFSAGRSAPYRPDLMEFAPCDETPDPIDLWWMLDRIDLLQRETRR